MMEPDLSWDDIRIQRKPLLEKALAVLERHRNQRDFRLVTTLSYAKAKEWADYAQDLRDVTLQENPNTVIWPEEPAE
jgi:hypothetical protein